jgi:hypothetical protein
MTQSLSEETKLLLEAANRVIERNRLAIRQSREAYGACIEELRAQERRFAFLRELKKREQFMK